MRSLLLPFWLIFLLLPGCPTDEGDDDSSGDDDDGPPAAGEDLDEEGERDLQADYELPAAFFDALETLGLETSDLNYPDAGATFDEIPTRLHWTDTLRHDGQTAPVFAHMVAADVQTALADPAGDRRVPELLAAQHTYNDRVGYRIRRYDERFELLDADEPLLAALRAYYEHDPVEGSPEPPEESWEEIEADVADDVDDFPLETQIDLALAIQGLVRAAELRDEALLDRGLLSMDDWGALHTDFFEGATDYSTYSHTYGTDAFPAIDLETMSMAGQLATRAVESLRLALLDDPPVDGARVKLDGPLGRIDIDFEDEDDEYESRDYFLLVDAAGDDIYLDQIAVNRSIYQPIAVLLDLDGDDRYGLTMNWDITAGYVPTHAGRMQGAGLFGVAILDDAAGSDSYMSAAMAQGAGVFGVGVLVDHGGDDEYRGYYECQGHAQFGYGLLADLGDGVDSYETLQMSQGYGGPMGIGWLVDEAGHDSYLAIEEPIVWDWAGEGTNWSGSQGFGYGVRDGFFTPGDPVFSGGLGGLFDHAGDDDYQCAVMCQGFGYAFGTGLFVDRAGDDDHLTTHKYSMGSATHWAAAVYLDLAGDDTYRNNGDDECIAEGYDASVAYHLDLGDGADTYTLDNAGDFTLGVSRIPALGVFLNEAGDDAYHVPGSGNRAIGRTYTADGNRDGYLGNVVSLGMFLDLGGTDEYDIAREEVTNGDEWIQVDPDGGDWNPDYDYGYGLDRD